MKPFSQEQRFKPAPAQTHERHVLQWAELAKRQPPARDWAIDHWVGMGHSTGLFGRGGVGKSLLVQQMGSTAALGRRLIDNVPRARTVLMWAAEDEPDELWRRQVAIAKSLDVPLEAFAGHFYVESFADRDATLFGRSLGELGPTAMLEELRAQVGDYGAEIVILDNIARVFAGQENDRYEVSAFLAALAGATCAAAVILCGHTAKSKDSEFSGSTAWENACRARLWFSDKLPDAPLSDDGEPASDVRYLSRRKANYSAKDLRTMRFAEGVFVVDPVEAAGGGLLDSLRRDKADRVAVDALRRLIGMGLAPSDNASAQNNLPKLVVDYRLSEGLTKKELADAMRRLMVDGRLKRQQVGTYANRTPRFGLVEA